MVAFYASLPADQAPLNKLTLKIETSINGLEKTDYITKTAKEWLSDSNKELYLDILIDQIFYKGGTPGNRIPDFEAFYKDGADREITVGEDKYTTAWVALGGWKSKATLVAEKKATLVAKSTAAFGTALLSVNGKTFEYLSVMPSEADVKLVGYANAGAYGQYLGYTDTDLVFVAKNYEAILADYTAAIEFWTAELAKVKASIVAANNAIKVANADVTAATKAKNKFVAAYTAEYNNAVAALNAKVQSLNAVKNALINAVDVYLAENYSGEENFMDWLANQVKSLEANVINLNKQVAIAEANLKAAEEGHFLTADNVARIQCELADLEEKLAGIVAQLEEAVAALATAQEIWAE